MEEPHSTAGWCEWLLTCHRRRAAGGRFIKSEPKLSTVVHTNREGIALHNVCMEMCTHVHTCMHTYSWKRAPWQNNSWDSQSRSGKGWEARGCYHRFSNGYNLDCLRFSYSCLDQTDFSQHSRQQHVVSHFPSPTLTGHYCPMGAGHQQEGSV